MTRSLDTRPNKQLQYVALGILCLGATVFIGILSLSQGDFFKPYFGPLPPLLAIGLVVVAGVAALTFLLARGWFVIFSGKRTLRGMALSAALATLLAIVMMVVDFRSPLPEDINVPLPPALLFYPAIGFVAEITFHAFPLSLLLGFLGSLLKKPNPENLVWFCILLVSIAEPIFQLVMASSEGPLSWTEAYVGLHVFIFNLLQLYIFRRFDFISMYSFRFVYYVHWHIVWGHLRLQLLF